MYWPLVRRSGIVGLVPPPTWVLRTERLKKSLQELKTEYQRSEGMVDQLYQAIFVDRFIPLSLIRRFSKWMNFWARGPESLARETGYSLFSYHKEPNPLPPRFLDQKDHPVPNERALMTDWISRLQKTWNRTLVVPPVDLDAVPEG